MAYSGYIWGPFGLLVVLIVLVDKACGYVAKPNRNPHAQLLLSAQYQIPKPQWDDGRLTSSHLDVAADSVGLLLSTSDAGEEVVHVWLPIGRKVYTRDDATLPSHPVTARLTTMIRSSPRVATPEHLDRLICEVFPCINNTGEETERWRPEAISVARHDDLVHLQDASALMGMPTWKEVEAYKCDVHPDARVL